MYIKRYTDYIKEDLKAEDVKKLQALNPHLWWLDKKELSKRSNILAEKLKKDCAPFIEEMAKHRAFMYRGTMKDTEDYTIKGVRKNRKPRNTESDISDEIDSLFLNRFGKRLRMETVFATAREQDASTYGDTYLFFPIGDYTYYWNEEVDDLFGVLDSLRCDENYSDEWIDEKLKELVDNYVEGNIGGAIRSEVEVMYDCEKYYLVKTAYESELMKLLFGKDEY